MKNRHSIFSTPGPNTHVLNRITLCLALFVGACSAGQDSTPAENVSEDTAEPAADTVGTGDPAATDSTTAEPEPVLPKYLINFTSDAVNIDGPTVKIAAEMDGDDLVKATVVGHALTDVFGIAFHVLFDPTTLELVNAEPANVLTNNTAKGVYGASLRQDGVLVYGGARFHPASSNGTPVTYTGVNLDNVELLTLTFQVKGSGTTTLRFSEQGRSVRNKELKWDTASWVGGTLVVSLAE